MDFYCQATCSQGSLVPQIFARIIRHRIPPWRAKWLKDAMLTSNGPCPNHLVRASSQSFMLGNRPRNLLSCTQVPGLFFKVDRAGFKEKPEHSRGLTRTQSLARLFTSARKQSEGEASLDGAEMTWRLSRKEMKKNAFACLNMSFHCWLPDQFSLEKIYTPDHFGKFRIHQSAELAGMLNYNRKQSKKVKAAKFSKKTCNHQQADSSETFWPTFYFWGQHLREPVLPPGPLGLRLYCLSTCGISPWNHADFFRSNPESFESPHQKVTV